jgi:hypothetical protein
MTGEELMGQFEEGKTPDGSFHHADHVRLAFEYLQKYDALKALGRFSAALKRLAAARGKSGLYNETITHAYFFLIRERMARHESGGWEEFARQNPDMLIWKNGVLGRYYQEETLKSDLARNTFVFPDKCFQG